ncbi:MAG TPA: hypothetical protein VLX29_09245 [Nitrospirota bacterium]|nr:hypothetical protein [Nitrospirota bacterium]
MKMKELVLATVLVLTASVSLAKQDLIVPLVVPNKDLQVFTRMSEIRANLDNYRLNRLIHLRIWTVFKTAQASKRFKKIMAERYYGGGATINNADYKTVVDTYEFMYGAMFGKAVHMSGYDKQGKIIADGDAADTFGLQDNGPVASILKQIRAIFERLDHE